MEIVIDIPEILYEKIQNSKADKRTLETVILRGKPLPENHGDLIDKSKIHKAIPAEEDNCTGMGMTYDEMYAYNDGIAAMYDLVQDAKPIIEADKGVLEKINEKQDSLRATCKAWDEATEKDGYVN